MGHSSIEPISEISGLGWPLGPTLGLPPPLIHNLEKVESLIPHVQDSLKLPNRMAVGSLETQVRQHVTQAVNDLHQFGVGLFKSFHR
jgi:hypothetical protein